MHPFQHHRNDKGRKRNLPPPPTTSPSATTSSITARTSTLPILITAKALSSRRRSRRRSDRATALHLLHKGGKIQLAGVGGALLHHHLVHHLHHLVGSGHALGRGTSLAVARGRGGATAAATAAAGARHARHRGHTRQRWEPAAHQQLELLVLLFDLFQRARHRLLLLFVHAPRELVEAVVEVVGYVGAGSAPRLDVLCQVGVDLDVCD